MSQTLPPLTNPGSYDGSDIALRANNPKEMLRLLSHRRELRNSIRPLRNWVVNGRLLLFAKGGAAQVSGNYPQPELEGAILAQDLFEQALSKEDLPMYFVCTNQGVLTELQSPDTDVPEECPSYLFETHNVTILGSTMMFPKPRFEPFHKKLVDHPFCSFEFSEKEPLFLLNFASSPTMLGLRQTVSVRETLVFLQEAEKLSFLRFAECEPPKKKMAAHRDSFSWAEVPLGDADMPVHVGVHRWFSRVVVPSELWNTVRDCSFMRQTVHQDNVLYLFGLRELKSVLTDIHEALTNASS